MGAMKNMEEFNTDKPNEIDELPHDALWSWIIIGIIIVVCLLLVFFSPVGLWL